MVPFSFPQPLLKSRVMNKHSSTIEVWTSGVWRLQLGAYAHSCLPAFLILIMAPAFRLYPVANHLLLKIQKRLNEPNSKNTNHLVNIDDLTHFDFFKKLKRTQFNPIFIAKVRPYPRHAGRVVTPNFQLLALPRPRIPKGLCPPAQGCAPCATLGNRFQFFPNPNGVASFP